MPTVLIQKQKKWTSNNIPFAETAGTPASLCKRK